MINGTKEKILENALELFAQSGYLGTSMSDIANRLGITKAALYKHYAGKQEILDSIILRMNELDTERAQAYDMPEGAAEETAEAYSHTPEDRIRAYSKAQFIHWTEDKFSSDFRKMLTLEQYRDPKMAELYQEYLGSGPVRYMTAVFSKITGTDSLAEQLALEFYGPIFLLYSLYDGAENKENIILMLDTHIDRFIEKIGK